MLNPISYIKNKGIRKTWQVFFMYKLDLIERKILMLFTRKMKLKDIIIIESHNDFDCNGGAYYNYLLSQGANDKYVIVWLLKNDIPNDLPHNVKAFGLNKPSFAKNYCICRAKFFFADQTITPKTRDDQYSFYLTHGGITFKNVKGRVVVPDFVDYILSPSKSYDEIMCRNYSIPYPNTRMLHFGMPKNDCLFDSTCENDVKKLGNESYDKVVIWMPTFRKLADSDRNDSEKEYPLGLPLVSDVKELMEINSILKTYNSLLVIKLHPSQDLTNIRLIPDFSNIKILSDLRAKKLGINAYNLMRNADGMISDYSSSAYSFLLLNRQIGFILDDLNEYKMGFNVDDYHSILPGKIILSFSEFLEFLENVLKDNDQYQGVRKKMLSWLYDNKDGCGSKRLYDFMISLDGK